MTSQYAKDQPKGYNNYIKNVAIVGAGGQIGSYIVSALLKQGKHNITALTRAGSSSKLPAGITTKSVDYADPATIVAALKGQDFLIITLSVTAPKDTHDILAKAAADAGIKWIMPNQYGIGPNNQASRESLIGDEKQKMRDYIESLNGPSWMALATCFWYEFSLAGAPDRFGFEVRGGKKEVTFFDEGTARIATTTWQQTGLAAARLLALKVLPEDEADKSVTLSSYANEFVFVKSFILTQRDMWASLMRVTGTKESDWVVKKEPAKERWANGVSAMKAGDLSGFSRAMYTRQFYSEEPSIYPNLSNEALGLPEEDLDEATKRALQWETEGVFVSPYNS